MKITRARTRVVRTPADNPLVVGIPQPGTREFVTLELDTDEGIQGIGLTFFGGALTQALKRAVDDLAALIIGDDPMPVEATAAKLRRAAASAGPGGIFTLALSAIDIALWDIKGKALNQPVSALLGGYRDRAPTYASGALMRPFNIEYLAEAGPRLVEMGFRQMKTQLGAEPSAAKAVERIQTLAMPDVTLRFMDATSMDFADNAFDRTLATYTISAAPDPVAVLREIRLILQSFLQYHMEREIRSAAFLTKFVAL